ncbi:MAG: DUF2273 domain-containing protein [Armatimonadota bacterium]
METNGTPVAPFWRACAGAAFGLVIGGVWLTKGFWAALFMLVCLIVGAIIGVIAMGPDEV